MIGSIPVIDLESPAVADTFRRAYGDVGFAYLEGHGVPQETRRRGVHCLGPFP